MSSGVSDLRRSDQSLVLNLKTRAMGLTIPATILANARR